MDGKFLGKIERARLVREDGRFGFVFDLSSAGGSTTDARVVWETRPDRAQWTLQERADQMAHIMARVMLIMAEAKKHDFAQLTGVPIEVEFDGNMLKSWRVLTEVL